MKPMKKKYIIPDTELIEIEATQLLNSSGVNAEEWGLVYGGFDIDGSTEPE